MRYEVLVEHKSDLENPIKLERGQTVIIGRESLESDGWINWVYTYSQDYSSEGWVPKQLLHIKSGHGTVLEQYSAAELNVHKSDIVTGELELNGWILCCRESSSENGWIPAEKLSPVEQKEGELNKGGNLK